MGYDFLILIRHIFIAVCALSSINLLSLNVGVRLDRRYEVARRMILWVLVPMPIYYSIKYYWFGAIDEIPALFSYNTLFVGSVAFSIFSALAEHFFEIDRFRLFHLHRSYLFTLIFLLLYALSLLIEDDVRSITWNGFLSTWSNLPQLIRFVQSFVLMGSMVYFGRVFFKAKRVYLSGLSVSDQERGAALARWSVRTYLMILSAFCVLVLSLFSSNIYVYCLFIMTIAFSFLVQTIRSFNFFSQWTVRRDDALISIDVEPLRGERLSELIEDRMRRDRLYAISGISADEVSRRLEIPRHKLNTYLKIGLNMNFNSWIQQHRIEEAKRVMDLNESMSISDLAHSLGYRDTAMFSRNFKILEGVSPRTYRSIRRSEGGID